MELTAMTCPNTTLSIFSGFRPAVCIAAVDATTDKSVALLFTNIPPIVPNGVRFAATMKMPVGDLKLIIYFLTSSFISQFWLYILLNCLNKNY